MKLPRSLWLAMVLLLLASALWVHASILAPLHALRIQRELDAQRIEQLVEFMNSFPKPE